MKRAPLLLLTLLLLCTACHDDKPEPQRARLKNVVVVCLWGENSLSGHLQRDLNEIRQGCAAIPDSCKLVVYFDNSRTSEMPRIITFDAHEGEQTLYEYRTDPVSTDSAAMQQMLGIVMRQLPAEHYALVIGSHGSGWIPAEPRYTIGIDNGKNTQSNTGQEMEVPTLAGVLRQTGCVWDYVLFDACFMQTVEVAYELRNVARWCIGSPAEIPAAGIPYDQMMASLFSGTDDAWRLAEAYYNAYRDQGGIVISAVRTSELDALAQATAPIVSRLPQYPSTEGIQKYYGRQYSGEWMPEYFDMGSAMHQWLDGDRYRERFDNYEYRQWYNAINRAVPHHFATPTWTTDYPYVDARLTDPERAVGLSLYIPTEGGLLNQAFTRFEWYNKSGWR